MKYQHIYTVTHSSPYALNPSEVLKIITKRNLQFSNKNMSLLLSLSASIENSKQMSRDFPEHKPNQESRGYYQNLPN